MGITIMTRQILTKQVGHHGVPVLGNSLSSSFYLIDAAKMGIVAEAPEVLVVALPLFAVPAVATHWSEVYLFLGDY